MHSWYWPKCVLCMSDCTPPLFCLFIFVCLFVCLFVCNKEKWFILFSWWKEAWNGLETRLCHILRNTCILYLIRQSGNLKCCRLLTLFKSDDSHGRCNVSFTAGSSDCPGDRDAGEGTSVTLDGEGCHGGWKRVVVPWFIWEVCVRRRERR